MLRIALAQVAATDDKARNLEAINVAAVQAAASGSELVVLPEFSMYTLPTPDRRFLDAAEPLDGRFAQEVHRIACANGLTIVVGMLEQAPGDERPFNTLLVTSPQSAVEAVYRKVHLYGAFGANESAIVRPAEDLEPSVFDLSGVRFGLSTCYDLRFPEVSRLVVDAGAQVCLLPAYWAPGPRKEEHWSTLVRARAIENTVYYAAVGQAAPASFGRSMFVDPLGVVRAEAGEQPEMLTVEVDLDRLEQVRAVNPALADRRYRIATPGWGTGTVMRG
jgi:predicted amidohydrolase